MAENPKPAEEKKPEKEIKVVIDNEQTKILAEQLAKAEAAKKETEDKLKQVEAEKKVQEEAAKKSAEEAEDLKNKLAIVAEKKLEEKRKAVTEKANALLKDPERVKDITDKLSTPEGVAAMEYTMNVLEGQIKRGQEEFEAYKASELKKSEEAAAKAKTEADTKAAEEAKKVEEAKRLEEAKKAGEKPAPAGSAPMNAAQMGEQKSTDLMHIKFESYQAMVRYLHDVENGPDPQKAAEAKAILSDLLRKWAGLVKQNYDTMQGAPTQGFENAPKFQDILKSKRAQEELRRRQQGGQPENVVTG
jgi:colicin import membrane protein